MKKLKPMITLLAGGMIFAGAMIADKEYQDNQKLGGSLIASGIAIMIANMVFNK